MKEVAERLQMLRRLHMDATSDCEDSYYVKKHKGSPSMAAPLDEMTYSSVEASTLIFA
jgi:hypothetical protein